MKVDNCVLDIVKSEYGCTEANFVSREFYLLAEAIRISDSMPLPDTFQSAYNLFFKLIEIFDD